MATGSDQEALARALYMEVDYPGSIKAHERALAAYREEGDALSAARAARVLEPHGESRRRRLEAAVELGRRFGDTDLEFAALSRLGEDLVAAGRIEEGMRLFDESLTAVCAGEVEDLEVVESGWSRRSTERPTRG